MILSYEHFIDKLNEHICQNSALCYELLVKVINDPNRYTGIFRVSNTKTKLIQNVTQSREIRFGDFLEDIVTDYIGAMGPYTNLDKNIGKGEDGKDLNADQVFMAGDTVYLIEQKVRDDHDSSKKRGQYENFQKKMYLLRAKYPDKRLDASMWFIDDSLVKHKTYYLGRAAEETIENAEIHIFYGETLFEELFGRMDVWDEIVGYLQKNKRERSDEILTVPDFDTSEEMLEALRRLKSENAKLFKKLKSDKPKYVRLRSELFPTGYNLGRV